MKEQYNDFFERAEKEINNAVYKEDNKFFFLVESILQEKL